MKKQISSLLKSKDLKDISLEMVEMIIDNNISDTVLKEIPILKSIIALKNIYTSFTDKIYIRKAMNVLLEIGQLSPSDRISFFSSLEDENGNGIDKILLIIDKLDTFSKCTIFGKLCKLKSVQNIEVDTFLRLTKIIQDSYLDDLKLIQYFTSNDSANIIEEQYYPLINLGLIYRVTSKNNPILRNYKQMSEDDPEFLGGEIEVKYHLTHLGEYLLTNYDLLFR